MIEADTVSHCGGWVSRHKATGATRRGTERHGDTVIMVYPHLTKLSRNYAMSKNLAIVRVQNNNAYH
ncbi:hypothetical protein [Calothrix rhizosoleniae]|uniref:hypothetical protein n=1 Tax=Calothrix rhizosoleniae TaxID=888997 RepID=UPI000B4A3B02|nr:hypothetical protein [Calothrix rhizosoleniae]